LFAVSFFRFLMAIDLELDRSRARVARSILALATGAADEVEVVLVSLLLLNAQAFAVLPGVAPLARHAVCAIVDLAVDPTDTIEHPVVFLFLELLESLLGPFDLGLSSSV